MDSLPKMDKKALRLVLLVTLLFSEVCFITYHYIVPEYYAQKYAPPGHWELETPFRDSPLWEIAAIAFLALFIAGNAGLIILILRAFKDYLKPNPQTR